MSFNSFLRRASSSMTLLWTFRSITSVRPYQRSLSVLDPLNSGRQFPTFVRFFTAPVEKAPPEEEPAGETVTESTLDGFRIKDCPNKEGSLTLTRKFQHEIIIIHATPYQNFMDYYKREPYEEPEECWCFQPSDYEKVACKKLENPEVFDVNNPCLHLEVNINHGWMYKKNISFDVLAFADSPDKIFIRSMLARVLPCEEEKYRRLHFEGFKDFLKNKGIESTSLNYFSRVLSFEDSFKYEAWYDSTNHYQEIKHISW